MKGNQGYAGLVWPLFFTAVYYLVFSGAATILLGKLEKTKLARREKQEGNAKEVHLYATPAGERAAQEHKAYSTGHTAQLLAAVDDCTEEEKEAFFKVLDRLGDFYGRLLELPREGEPS